MSASTVTASLVVEAGLRDPGIAIQAGGRSLAVRGVGDDIAAVDLDGAVAVREEDLGTSHSILAPQAVAAIRATAAAAASGVSGVILVISEDPAISHRVWSGTGLGNRAGADGAVRVLAEAMLQHARGGVDSEPAIHASVLRVRGSRVWDVLRSVAGIAGECDLEVTRSPVPAAVEAIEVAVTHADHVEEIVSLVFRDAEDHEGGALNVPMTDPHGVPLAAHDVLILRFGSGATGTSGPSEDSGARVAVIRLDSATPRPRDGGVGSSRSSVVSDASSSSSPAVADWVWALRDSLEAAEARTPLAADDESHPIARWVGPALRGQASLVAVAGAHVGTSPIARATAVATIRFAARLRNAVAIGAAAVSRSAGVSHTAHHAAAAAAADVRHASGSTVVIKPHQPPSNDDGQPYTNGVAARISTADPTHAPSGDLPRHLSSPRESQGSSPSSLDASSILTDDALDVSVGSPHASASGRPDSSPGYASAHGPPSRVAPTTASVVRSPRWASSGPPLIPAASAGPARHLQQQLQSPSGGRGAARDWGAIGGHRSPGGSELLPPPLDVASLGEMPSVASLDSVSIQLQRSHAEAAASAITQLRVRCAMLEQEASEATAAKEEARSLRNEALRLRRRLREQNAALQDAARFREVLEASVEKMRRDMESLANDRDTAIEALREARAQMARQRAVVDRLRSAMQDPRGATHGSSMSGEGYAAAHVRALLATGAGTAPQPHLQQRASMMHDSSRRSGARASVGGQERGRRELATAELVWAEGRSPSPSGRRSASASASESASPSPSRARSRSQSAPRADPTVGYNGQPLSRAALMARANAAWSGNLRNESVLEGRTTSRPLSAGRGAAAAASTRSAVGGSGPRSSSIYAPTASSRARTAASGDTASTSTLQGRGGRASDASRTRPLGRHAAGAASSAAAAYPQLRSRRPPPADDDDPLVRALGLGSSSTAATVDDEQQPEPLDVDDMENESLFVSRSVATSATRLTRA